MPPAIAARAAAPRRAKAVHASGSIRAPRSPGDIAVNPRAVSHVRLPAQEVTMQKQILALDVAGSPRKWVSAQTAVCYYARSLVVWEHGAHAAVFRGGWQKGGQRSR